MPLHAYHKQLSNAHESEPWHLKAGSTFFNHAPLVAAKPQQRCWQHLKKNNHHMSEFNEWLAALRTQRVVEESHT